MSNLLKVGILSEGRCRVHKMPPVTNYMDFLARPMASLPLGFIFTGMTNGSAKPGAKQRILTEVLAALSKHCPNIKFTLSDKDPSEINACRTSMANAKHQLCYWHGVRYIDEQFAEDKSPAF
jgi:hypothetical protein